jgi:hypothetical protein
MKAMRVGKDTSAPGGAGGCEYESREVPDGSSGWIISGNDMITYFHIFGDYGKIGPRQSQRRVQAGVVP